MLNDQSVGVHWEWIHRFVLVSDAGVIGVIAMVIAINNDTRC